jgi:hypothetical protein
LGRELSLNEFLGVFAPDDKGLLYSPILPDAHEFRDAFFATHAPETVEFSRKHQRSAIKWVPRDQASVSAMYWKTNSDFLNTGDFEYASHSRGQDPRAARSTFGTLAYLDFADLVGDDTDVSVVKSRIGVVMQEQSAASFVAQTIKQALARLIDLRRYDDLLTVLSLASACMSGMLRPGPRHYEPPLTSAGAIVLWQQNVDSANRILSSLNIPDKLPNDPAAAITTFRSVFNASDYWTDWWRQRNE